MSKVERRKQIRRDIDQYIAQRRKGGWSLFEKKDSPLHPSMHPYKNGEEDTKEEMAEDVEEEYEEEAKEGFFSRVLKGLFGSDEEAEMDVSEEEGETMPEPTFEETKQDLKAVATISLGVMRKMSGDNIREFKQSEDYDKFKSILRKHKLIK